MLPTRESGGSSKQQGQSRKSAGRGAMGSAFQRVHLQHRRHRPAPAFANPAGGALLLPERQCQRHRLRECFLLELRHLARLLGKVSSDDAYDVYSAPSTADSTEPGPSSSPAFAWAGGQLFHQTASPPI